ncbi:MAG: hypothetical protein WC091_00835 [Sulfuricellaceae bacterium]
MSCKRADKCVLRQYLLKLTGLSRAQVARCALQVAGGGQIKVRHHAPAVPFARRYTTKDIRLLDEMDALRGTLSDTTTRKLCGGRSRCMEIPALSGWRAFPTDTRKTTGFHCIPSKLA